MCMLYSTAFTQAKSGVESYNFLSQGKDYIWVPVLHYQAKNGAYAELRYNYEDVQTLSLFGGKTISGGKSLQYSITPLIGFSAGNFTGVSLAANAEIDWKSFYISSQTQYSIATKQNIADFLFSWSELGYNISSKFFGGLAIQYTRQTDINDIEPGFVAGINLKNFSIPCYVFNPFNPDRYFVVGLNFEFDYKN